MGFQKFHFPLVGWKDVWAEIKQATLGSHLHESLALERLNCFMLAKHTGDSGYQ